MSLTISSSLTMSTLTSSTWTAWSSLTWGSPSQPGCILRTESGVRMQPWVTHSSSSLMTTTNRLLNSYLRPATVVWRLNWRSTLMTQGLIQLPRLLHQHWLSRNGSLSKHKSRDHPLSSRLMELAQPPLLLSQLRHLLTWLTMYWVMGLIPWYTLLRVR